ncbi:hypothetical protein BN2475_950055 [Paraburkholderia ribeironis]|uniref:Uncharacterized protein n=1 Tax=Paraburkholderia ribeironis TaxID=1247936 RepID=A0A1N7SLI7_9BURK|nr:hypothetical protein BN2475_950055 [Paraburkholderia ribeironis]
MRADRDAGAAARRGRVAIRSTTQAITAATVMQQIEATMTRVSHIALPTDPEKAKAPQAF